MSFATKAPRVILRLAGVLILGVSSSAAFAQSVVEAKFVLKDIGNWLPGTFDNEPQIYLEDAFGISDSGTARPRERVVVSTIDDTGLGDQVYHVTVTREDQPDRPVSHSLVAFDVVEEARAVRMRRFAAHSDKGSNDSADGAALAATATEHHPDCPVWWRQGPGDVLYGSMQHTWCASADGEADTILRRSDWMLSDGELFVLTGTRDPVSQKLDRGRSDEVPTRYMRVKQYECFVNVIHRDGSGRTTINPFTMDDGGGQFTFETEEPEPRRIEIVLRRSMWPSRSGNNFVPLLALWVYENGNKEEPLAAAWSTADSGRVGWDTHHVGGGRCKIPTSKPF